MTDRLKPEVGPVDFFSTDHRACDEEWAAVEAAADNGDVEATREAFAKFDAAMRRHFDMEEHVLFPAIEDATGMTMGPTRMMRYEHDQMKGLLAQMASMAHSPSALVDQGDTLLMMIQQHNVKEEGILYPMAHAHLGRAWDPIAKKLERYL